MSTTPNLRVIKCNGFKTGAYIGFVALAKILAATKTPVTALQVSQQTGITHIRAKSLMHQFRVLGLVHRIGFVKPSNGFVSPVYLIGAGENVPAPVMPNGKPQPHVDHRPAIQPRVLTFSAIVQAMQASPATALQIIEQAHAGQANGRAAIAALRKVGLCFIAEFTRRDGASGPQIARYEFGIDQRDARKQALQGVRRRDETRRVFRPAWHNMVAQLAGRPVRCSKAAA